MTQTHVPAEPEASARPAAPPPTPPPSAPPLSLTYATPQPKTAAEDVGFLIAVAVRRLIFAIGVGLLTAGVVNALAEARRDDPATLAGIGAGMIALVVPFRKLSEPMRLDRNA